jgi:hypothetical protein
MHLFVKGNPPTVRFFPAKKVLALALQTDAMEKGLDRGSLLDGGPALQSKASHTRW